MAGEPSTSSSPLWVCYLTLILKPFHAAGAPPQPVGIQGILYSTHLPVHAALERVLMHQPSSNPQPVVPSLPQKHPRDPAGGRGGSGNSQWCSPKSHTPSGSGQVLNSASKLNGFARDAAGSGVIKSTFPTAQTGLEVIKAASPPRLGVFRVTLPRNSSQHLPQLLPQRAGRGWKPLDGVFPEENGDLAKNEPFLALLPSPGPP